MNPKMIMPLLIALFGAYIGIKVFVSNSDAKYLALVLIITFVSVFGWLLYFGDGSKRLNQNKLTAEEQYEACRAIETQIQQTEAALKNEPWSVSHSGPGTFVERTYTSNQILRAALMKLRA